MANLNKSAKQINQLIESRVKVSQRKIAQKYANTLNEIRLELSKIYESYEVDGVLTYTEMAKYNRLTKLMKMVDTLLAKNYSGIRSIIYDVLGESYLDGYYLTAWAVETDTLSKLAYSAISATTIKAMIENPITGLTLSERLERNRVMILYTIRQEVTQGLVKGETYRTLVNRLKTALEIDTVKSMRIVRTEAHRVQEASKHESALHAHKSGVRMSKSWKSMQDERVRPGRGIGKTDAKVGSDHRYLDDGKKIPIDQDFIGKLGKGPIPGQLGHPSEDINCRCYVSYTVESIQKPDAKELETMVFEDWKKERLMS